MGRVPEGALQQHTADQRKMAVLKPTHVVAAGSWKVKGLLRTSGVHAGAIEFRFQGPKSETWGPGSTAVPKALTDAVDKAKDQIKKTLKDRFNKSGIAGRGAAPKPVLKKPAAKK